MPHSVAISVMKRLCLAALTVGLASAFAASTHSTVPHYDNSLNYVMLEKCSQLFPNILMITLFTLVFSQSPDNCSKEFITLLLTVYLLLVLFIDQNSFVSF